MRLTDRADDREVVLLSPTNLTGAEVLAASHTTPADKLLLALCVLEGTMTPEAAEWLALHQAHKSGVTNLTSNYSNGSQPLTSYLADALDKLIANGFIALGTPSSIGHHRVLVTHTGQPQYSALGKPTPPPEQGVVPHEH